MPEETAGMQGTPTRHLVRLLIVICAVIIAILAAFYIYLRISSFGTAADLKPYEPTQLIDSKRMGDHSTAVKNFEAIQNDPLQKADAKALAVYNIYGSRFKLSANILDQIKDVQDMKKVILDPNVALWTRVNTLNILSASYCGSGRDPAVLGEIYKDAPFNTYFVEGEPDLSARHISEWSYSMMPTSFAAVRIARWYSEQKITYPNLAATTTAEYVAKAEQYLGYADTYAAVEAKNDPQYHDSSRYMLYRFWKAIIIGRLAREKGAPYTGTYRGEYDNFFKFAQAQQNAVAKEYIYYARFFFSGQLMADKDATAAKAQLDQLAQELNSMSNPDVSTFVRFLRFESTRPTGQNWRLAQYLFKTSPDFKAAVDHVIATAPKETEASVSAPIDDISR